MKPRRRPDPRGFTLLELLVAMAVLTLLLLLCSQVLMVAISTWTSGRSQADNFSQARVALDIIARDLETAVLRKDTPAFFNSSGPMLTFYTRQVGLISSNASGNRPISRVAYNVTTDSSGNSVLRRSANGFNFGDDMGYSPATWAVLLASPSYDADIGPGVLVLKYQFIGSDGLDVMPANVNPGWTASGATPGVGTLKAVTLSMAVIDAESLKVLNASGKLAALQANFTADDPGQLRSFATAWQAQLDSAAKPLATGTIPARAIDGIKVFERTVMIGALSKN